MIDTEEEIVSALAEIVNEIAGTPASAVRPEKSFADDLDIDSLSMVEVIIATEERFGLTISDDRASELKTVADAVRYIQDHRS